MHELIQQLLHKRGIDDIKKLDKDERQQIERWQSVLSKEVSVESIAEMCEREKGLIENQWRNLDNPPQKNERLIMLHTMYSRILHAIKDPLTQKERADVEAELHSYLYG